MNKRKQLQKINDLLDQCGDCPKRLIAGKPDTICGHCTLYHKIRVEGKKLWPREEVNAVGRKAFDMPEAEYFALREKGFNDEEIAFEKEVSSAAIKTWKKRKDIHITRQRPKPQKSINPKVYEQLANRGLKTSQMAEQLGVSISKLKQFRQSHGYSGERRQPIHSDEEVLQAMVDKRSYWWIQKHLRCGRARADRLAEEHGITR